MRSGSGRSRSRSAQARRLARAFPPHPRPPGRASTTLAPTDESGELERATGLDLIQHRALHEAVGGELERTPAARLVERRSSPRHPPRIRRRRGSDHFSHTSSAPPPPGTRRRPWLPRYAFTSSWTPPSSSRRTPRSTGLPVRSDRTSIGSRNGPNRSTRAGGRGPRRVQRTSSERAPPSRKPCTGSGSACAARRSSTPGVRILRHGHGVAPPPRVSVSE